MCRNVIGVWLVAAFLLCNTADAQQYAYQIAFTDKNNTPYSLGSPLSYLSSRSVARRATQGIAIDSTDIPVNSFYTDSAIALTNGIYHNSSRWFNHCVLLLADSSLIHNLEGKTFIKSIRLVGVYGSILHTAPTVAQQLLPAAKTTADASFYGATWDQTIIVKGNHLHSNGYDGAGKLIAVIDAGYTGTDTHAGFDSMRNSGRLLDVHNFTLATSNVYSYDVHGTEVLSTMAGYVPGAFVGSAPKASYALYVTEDNTSEQPIELLNMISAAERADSLGADIITTSLGYNTFDDPADNFVFATDFDGKTTNVAVAANMATQKGILFVASAGNEGGGGWNRVLTPGDADSALTIGSVDISGNPWNTSGYGPNAAGQVKPDVCALGHVASVFSAAGGYTQEDGTSFSTPQIAGWAACLLQLTPAATPYELRQAIIRCASSYSSPTSHIGYGIPNFQCTEQVLNVITPPPFTAANWVIVMPNPFSSELKIEVSPDTNQDVSISIFDIAGKKVTSFSQYVFKGSNNPITLSMPGLPSGIYVLKAASATQQQVMRIEKR